MPLKATKAEAAAMQARIVQLTIDGDGDDVTPAKKRDNPEERAQIALFELRDARAERYPALRRMFATLNGVYLPQGIKQRVIDSGVTAGVLDVWLPVPRLDLNGVEWKGLVCDLKFGTGTPSPEQLDWANYLASVGWRAYFTGGAQAKKIGLTTLEETWFVISAYLGIGGEPPYLTDEEAYRLEILRGQRRTAKQANRLTSAARTRAK